MDRGRWLSEFGTAVLGRSGELLQTGCEAVRLKPRGDAAGEWKEKSGPISGFAWENRGEHSQGPGRAPRHMGTAACKTGCSFSDSFKRV